MNEPAPEDDAFIAALRAGDEAAFTVLVRRHHRALRALAATIVSDADAEEVVQLAWIKAHRALPGFEGRAALRTWLSRIVINEARMLLRSRRREVFIDDLAPDSPDPLATHFNASGHWSSPPHRWHDDGPDALLTAEQLQDCLERVLREMPEAQRTLLEMRDVGGIEFEEICNILSISASNARVLLHRARSRVFRLVDHYQETGEC